MTVFHVSFSFVCKGVTSINFSENMISAGTENGKLLFFDIRCLEKDTITESLTTLYASDGWLVSSCCAVIPNSIVVMF